MKSKLKMLEYYEKMFGIEKIYDLFTEFLSKVTDDLTKAKQIVNEGNSQELRIIYHTLRSSCLIFGMNKFSQECSKIEEKFLNEVSITPIDIKKAEDIFNKDKQ